MIESVYFAFWGKHHAGAILPLAQYNIYSFGFKQDLKLSVYRIWIGFWNEIVGFEKPKSVHLCYVGLLPYSVPGAWVIPCQAIQSYISDHEQNPWNFISREISSFFISKHFDFFKSDQYSQSYGWLKLAVFPFNFCIYFLWI